MSSSTAEPEQTLRLIIISDHPHVDHLTHTDCGRYDTLVEADQTRQGILAILHIYADIGISMHVIA